MTPVGHPLPGDPRVGLRVVSPPALRGVAVVEVLALDDGRCVLVLDREVPGLGPAAVLEGQVVLAPAVGGGPEGEA